MMLDVYGLWLFSSWFNLFLYITELIFAVQYFDRFSKGARWIHCMIICMIAADTLGTIAACAATWNNLITYAMDPPAHQLWTMPTLMLTTATTAMLEQSFLIYRVFTLSKARLVSALLMLLVFTHVTFKAIGAGYIIVDPRFVYNFGSTATTIAYCIEATVDILIPVALLWQLRKVRSTFESTRSLLRRLSIQAFTSGCIVAFVGIAFLALFCKGRLEFLVITTCFGRIYTITVLMNLLGRKGGVAEKGVPSNGGAISQLFNLDHSTGTESFVPNNASSVVPGTNVETKEHRELSSQQSDETLRMAQQEKQSTVSV